MSFSSKVKKTSEKCIFYKAAPIVVTIIILVTINFVPWICIYKSSIESTYDAYMDLHIQSSVSASTSKNPCPTVC